MCRTFLGCKELLQSTAWELVVGQTASDYAECSGYDCLRRTLRSSSHAGGHWFESSSLHQIPPHLRWDFSFARTPQTVVTARFSSLHANSFDTTLQQVGTNFFASIDFLKGRVAFDLEWNSKDQTFDRDLLAMRTYYDCDIVSDGLGGWVHRWARPRKPLIIFWNFAQGRNTLPYMQIHLGDSRIEPERNTYKKHTVRKVD